MEEKSVQVLLAAARAGFDAAHGTGADLPPEALTELLADLAYVGVMMAGRVSPGACEGADPGPHYPPEMTHKEMLELYQAADLEHSRRQLRYLWMRLVLARVVMAATDLLITAYFNHAGVPAEVRGATLAAAAESAGAALEAFDIVDDILPRVPTPE